MVFDFFSFLYFLMMGHNLGISSPSTLRVRRSAVHNHLEAVGVEVQNLFRQPPVLCTRIPHRHFIEVEGQLLLVGVGR